MHVDPRTRFGGRRVAALAFSFAPSVGNIGDDVQQLSLLQHLAIEPDDFVVREELATYEPGAKTVLLYVGWFAHDPQASVPTSDDVDAIIVGFHLASGGRSETFFLHGAGRDFLVRHGPVGCRDRATFQRLQAAGIPAEYTGCVTLTQRPATPSGATTFAVDWPLPRGMRDGTETVSHVTSRLHEPATRRRMAAEVLAAYRARARTIVTGRLHCVLPCAAMGLPVVFFGDDRDPRFSIVRDAGIPIHKVPNRALRVATQVPRLGDLVARVVYRRVDWAGTVVDTSPWRARVDDFVARRLAAILGTEAPASDGDLAATGGRQSA